ncbi:DNA-binding response regulator [Pseudonocardia lutea]|uniref:DNA-binding response regulator n=1 Tax=Pseudonocardia lutea TaxID=2172015 RepID=A0ABW1IFJ4_9PSEU
MINIVVVDANRVFADAVAARLGQERDMTILRCATGVTALRQAMTRSSADVVIGDASLFDPELVAPADGLAFRTRPQGMDRADGDPMRVLVLVAAANECDRLADCLVRGVRGWVPRSASMEELIAAVRHAADGGTWIPPRLLTDALRELLWPQAVEDPAEALLKRLTPREREVLSCLVEGLDRSGVAARLQLSPNTVRTHVQSILGKLGVNSAVAAVALIRRAGSTLRPPPPGVPVPTVSPIAGGAPLHSARRHQHVAR